MTAYKILAGLEFRRVLFRSRQAADLIEQRLSEEALRESEEKYRLRLEGEVRERTAELNRTKESLQATLDSSLYIVQAFEAVRDEKGKIVDFKWLFTKIGRAHV